MGLPKGRTNNPKGREKGSVNRRTEDWLDLGDAMRNRHAARVNKIMDKMSDDDFIDAYIRLIEHFKPKLQRSEVKSEAEITVQQSMIIGGQKIIF